LKRKKRPAAVRRVLKKGIVGARRVFTFLTMAILVAPALLRAGHESRDVTTIPADRLKSLLEAGERFLLVDIRPAKEFQDKRLPGSRSIPMADLDKRLGEIPKSGRVIIYAATPQDEIPDSVFQLFEDNRYRNVAFMLEGFTGWEKRKFPIERGAR
jgi:rhodanese-related sulfurtransferase